MRRRIANIFAATLGLLCAAFIILGVRSFWIGNCITQGTLDPETSVVDCCTANSEAGCLFYYHGQARPNEQSAISAWLDRWRSSWTDGEWHVDEVGYFAMHGNYWWDSLRPRVTHRRLSLVGGSGDQWMIQIPYWIPILLTGTWPIIRFTRPILRRRPESRWRIREQCVTCGYDLRAHKPGEKCPECGREIAAADADLGGTRGNNDRGIAGDLRKPEE